MSAFRVSAQLGLVQRDEGEILFRAGFPAAGDRHGFGGAKKIARAWRNDLFLASDQRDQLFALDGHHPIINFARQQTQGKTHHAAGMAAHPLYSQMGLACVGWPQDGSDGRSGEGNHDGAYVGHRGIGGKG